MNLGKRLSVAFQLMQLRVPDVAKATGIPATTINALFRRDSQRSAYTEQLLQFLPPERVSHEWVRSGEGTMEPKPGSVTATTTTTTGSGETATRTKETASESTRPIAHAISSAATCDSVAPAPLRSWEHLASLPTEGEWLFVPKLGIVHSKSAGKESITSVLLIKDVHTFQADWIRNDGLKPSALAWSQANDASMEPSISQGDHYVVDTSETEIHDGKTYAVWYGGAERARRLFTLPNGGLRVKPLNAEFETLDLTPDQAAAFQVVGRVVHRAGRGGL